MRRRLVLGLVSLLVAAPPSRGEYNYHGPTELLLGLGTRALMICNGRFVSNRTLDQIYEQELKLDQMPVLPPGPDRREAAGGRGRRREHPDQYLAFPRTALLDRIGTRNTLLGVDASRTSCSAARSTRTPATSRASVCRT